MDFEQLGASTKSLFKNKKFVLLCVIVGVVALILWIIKENKKALSSSSEGTDYYDGSQAIGYAGYGYPYGGDDSVSDYDWFYEKMDSLIESNDQKWESIVDQMNDKYDQMLDKYDQLMENLDKEDEKDNSWWGGGYSGGSSSSSKINEQAIIDMMQQNSNAWWDVTSEAGREALHDENIYLAGQIGAQYDGSTGTWWKDGQQLYTVDNANPQKLVTSTGTRQASSASVSYSNNVDYQAEINNALRSGASADVINSLNAQREAKIASTGNRVDANSSFDANTDYQALINQAKSVGADQSVIDNLTAQRNAKIAAQSTANRVDKNSV